MILVCQVRVVGGRDWVGPHGWVGRLVLGHTEPKYAVPLYVSREVVEIGGGSFDLWGHRVTLSEFNHELEGESTR